MPTETIAFLVFIALVTTVIVVGAVVRGRKLAAHEEELSRGASARGWKFESLKKGGYRIQRYQGDPDGVEWVAESLVNMASNRNRHREVKIARWHGRWAAGVNAPIVCLGIDKGVEAPEFPSAEGAGFFARMVQKAAGYAFDVTLDKLFGEEAGAEVDAATLRPVEETLDGFIVMASDKDEAKRVLADGLERALRDGMNQAGSVLAQDNRPSLLIQPKGISLARTEQIQTINELEQFIQAGVGLTRAFKFGRRA